MVNTAYTKVKYSGPTTTKTVCASCGFGENVVGELTGYVLEETCDVCGRFGDGRAVVQIPREV